MDDDFRKHLWLSNFIARNTTTGHYLNLSGVDNGLTNHLNKIYPRMLGSNKLTFALLSEDMFNSFIEMFGSRDNVIKLISTFAESLFIYDYATESASYEVFKN